MSQLYKDTCSDEYKRLDVERTVTEIAVEGPKKFALYVRILKQGAEIHGFGETTLYASPDEAKSAGLSIAMHHIDGLLK